MSGPLQQWLQKVGDPTVAGWACFVGYFAAAGFCYVASRAKREKHRHHVLFWTGTITVLILLGANKQLDLQTLLIAELRQLFGASQAWSYRHVFAVTMVVVLSPLVAVAFGSVASRLKSEPRFIQVLLVAMLLLVALAMARAIPGPIDDVLLTHVAGSDKGVFHTHVKEVIELSLVLIIAVSAAC